MIGLSERSFFWCFCDYARFSMIQRKLILTDAGKSGPTAGMMAVTVPLRLLRKSSSLCLSWFISMRSL